MTVPHANNSDQQKKQTKLEIETGRERGEQFASLNASGKQTVLPPTNNWSVSSEPSLSETRERKAAPAIPPKTPIECVQYDGAYINKSKQNGPTREQVADFMARVVPWPVLGQPGVVNLEWFQLQRGSRYERFETGKPYMSVATFLDAAAYYVKHRGRGYQDQYFCLSLQSQTKMSRSGKSVVAKRSKDCVLGFKSVWLDVDVKPGAYPSTEEALAAIIAFCEHYKIARPTAMVRSGSGGIHVYWISKTILSMKEWRNYATRLKQAATDFKLHFDAKCTVNPVQILRVPGSYNYKEQIKIYTTHAEKKDSSSLPHVPAPKLVGLAYLDQDDLDFPTALAGLPAVPVTAPVTLTAAHPPTMLDPALFPIKPPVPNLLGEAFSHEPLDPLPVITQCPMFIKAFNDGGKDQPQGVWMNMALACTFFANGHHLFHKMSAGYHGSTQTIREDMWQRKLAESAVTRSDGLRWPSCRAFEDQGCQECKGCPLKGTINSPLNLAARAITASPITPPNSLATQIGPALNTARTGQGHAVHVSSLPLVPAKRQWLHGNDLIRGAVTVLAAPGGRAKSTWLLTCALACAAGRPLLGSHVFGGPLRVLCLSTEDGLHEMALRLRAIMKHYGLTDAHLPALYVIGSDRWGLPLIRAQGKWAVLDQSGIGALTAELDRAMPDVLIIDPLINVMGGANANDNATAALLMGHLAGLAATRRISIALAHHISKGRDVTSAESAMGAASFVNLARIALAIEFLNEKDAATVGLAPWEAWRIFRVLGTKQNFSPPKANDRWFRLVSVDMPNADPPIYMNGDEVAVVEPFTPGVSSSAFSDQMVRDALVSVDTAQPPLSPSKNTNRCAAPVIAQAIARHRGGLASEIEGDAVLKHLLKAGFIFIDDVKLGRPGGRSDTRKGLVLTPAGKAAMQQPTPTADVTPQSPQSPATPIRGGAGGDPLGPPQRQGGCGGNAGRQTDATGRQVLEGEPSKDDEQVPPAPTPQPANDNAENKIARCD
jgi:hypothetical protein